MGHRGDNEGRRKTTMDLSKLSREEKLELIALAEEAERRERRKKPKFSPTKGQKPVMESNARWRFIFSGNGSGKTTMLCQELHWAATGHNPLTGDHSPVPAKIALVLDNPEKINDILTEYRKWYELPAEWCSKAGKPNFSYIQYDNGSTVTVLSHGVEPLKLEGSQWDYAFFDEPPEKYVFVGVTRGLRQKGRPNRMLMAGTPITAAWLRMDIYEPWLRGELDHVECFKGSTYDNIDNLGEDEIKAFTSTLSEHEKQTRLYGDFFSLDGLALAHLWDRSTHILPHVEWMEGWPVTIAIDPHPAKAHHAVMLGADKDDQLYVLKHTRKKLTPREFARHLISWVDGFKVIDIVCDSLGSSDMTGGEGFKSFIEVLNEEFRIKGYNIRARATTFKEKSDEDFVERIKDVLLIPETANNFGQKVPKLRVLEGCKEVISDIENAGWQRDRKANENKPKLEISNKDALACLKYALAASPWAGKDKARVYHRKSKLYGMPTRAQRKAKRLAKMVGGASE